MGFEGSEIDRLLSEAVGSGTFHGVVAMVVDPEGVLYEGAAGDADPDTIFRNASMTKAVATTGALQLVEQDRLRLDQTVESVLPEFAELQVIEGFDGERPILRPPAAKATIRQLMTHTAGLGYFFLNERLFRYGPATGLPSPLEGKKISLTAPLVNDPATAWEYGVNTDWLGLVVERLSGQTLGAYLTEHVYEPLAMTDSTFHPTDEQRARLMPIRMRAADGTLQPTELDLPTKPEWDAGGHGSYGTARDYARFIRAWLNDGELDGRRVLRAGTVAAAFEDHITGIPLPDVMRSCVPELSNDVPALPVPQGWGLGFHLVKADIPGMRSAGTGDWAGIFNTYYWIDRAARIGGLIMTQVLPFYDAKIVDTMMAFETGVYAQVGAAVPAA
jgi:methyl acetate hydrolase